jgi:hypothetical protein
MRVYPGSSKNLFSFMSSIRRDVGMAVAIRAGCAKYAGVMRHCFTEIQKRASKSDGSWAI